VDVVIDGTAARKKYAHWQECDTYIRNTRDRCDHLLEKFTDASVTNYACQCEEFIRAFAIEKTRNKEHPERWGSSLVSSMREHSYVWQDNRDLLVRIGGGQYGRTMSPPKTSRAAADSQSKGGSQHRSFVTVNKSQHGGTLCKKFNDRRGCKHKICPDGFVNVCDVKLTKSQYACGRGDHNRLNHDEQKHGAAESN
jgi:hypothetical protein